MSGAEPSRKRLPGWLWLLLLGGPAVAFIVANLLKQEAAPPLWTEAALPEPPAADNGWTLVKDYRESTLGDVDLDAMNHALAAANDNGAKLASLGRVLVPARVTAAKLGEHTARCREAFERPRFVSPCLSPEQGGCSSEPLVVCSRLLRFAALDAASRARWAEAVTIMALVLRQANDAAAHSRHPWTQARALSMLRGAVHLSASIIKWRRVGLKEIERALEGVSEASLPLENLVIATYLFKHALLQKGLSQTDNWLVDPGAMMAGFNEPFAVAKAGAPLPEPPRYASGPFWWFDNPIGKKLLDVLQPGADQDYQRTLKLRAVVLKRRDEALALLAPRSK